MPYVLARSKTDGTQSLCFTGKLIAFRQFGQLLLLGQHDRDGAGALADGGRVEHEAEAAVEKLHSILPRQMFTTKIQGFALGRIISSRTLSAMRKDVTQHMYGGDITRKMKLREKQKKGKKKMAERGRVNISHDVFLKMVQKEQ